MPKKKPALAARVLVLLAGSTGNNNKIFRGLY